MVILLHQSAFLMPSIVLQMTVWRLSHRSRLFCLQTPSEIPVLAQAQQAVHYKPATRASMTERELTKPNVYRSFKKENHRRKIYWDLLNAKESPLIQGLDTSRGWASTMHCHPALQLFSGHLLQSTARGNKRTGWSSIWPSRAILRFLLQQT